MTILREPRYRPDSALSLTTELTPEGIKCTYRDGRSAGLITYTPADIDRGYPEAIWRALPEDATRFSNVAFVSREAAEYFVLAMAIEAEAMRGMGY